MICESCNYRFGCKRKLSKDRRCEKYRIDKEMVFSEELKINPKNGLIFNYDVILKFIDNFQPHISLKHPA
jgi:hypothetical protein